MPEYPLATRPMGRYPVGAVIQRRTGQIVIKTKNHGLMPRSRWMAENSSRVVNGGAELQKGWRVMHLDMSSFGEDDHDRAENLVVIKCRTTKYTISLKQSRIIHLPKSAVKWTDDKPVRPFVHR